MKHVPLHIDYLLTRHHCVTVAGLGAFLVNDVAARYDDETETYLAPSRLLGFNPELTISDGLLAGSIARREGLSLDEAAKIVSAEITEFFCTLSEQHSVVFGNLGTFVRSEGGVLTFEPSDSALCLSRFEGLPSIAIKPLADENAADNADASHRNAPRFSFLLKAVASMLLLFVLGGIITATTGLVDGKSVERAMLSAFAGQMADEIEMQPSAEISRFIELNIAAPAAETIRPASAIIPAPATPYLLVVASLESAASARRQIGDDPNLKYVEMEGKYRVYVDSFPTAQAAMEAVPSYMPKYENVWVCRR